MRSALALMAAILLLAATAGGASAARAFKETEHLQDIGCDGVVTPDGEAFFFASLSDLFGTDGNIAVFAGDPEDPDLVWSRDDGRDVEMTFDPTGVTAAIPVLPSGEALIRATLEPADPVDFADHGKDGNSSYRTSATGTFYAVTGTLTLPGGDEVALNPADCSASDVILRSFFSRPHAFVRSFSSSGGSCQLVNDQGDAADVFLGHDADDGFLFLDAFVVDDGGDAVEAVGSTILDGPTATIPIDEYDVETGEPTGDTGLAELSLSESDTRIDYVARWSNVRVRVTGSLIDVDGTLTTSLGSFDLDGCFIATTRTKEIVRPTNGPKPGGRVPANDLPSGAIALGPGSKASVSTKGAAVASEAGYPCMLLEDNDGNFVTVPVEHTVWYTVAGTGREITVDTSGSSFDTVVAVYAGAPDDAATVGCVDDVRLEPIGRSVQAAVTVPTVAGTTYWVQIGGFQEGAIGPNPNVPYGSLRVAVR